MKRKATVFSFASLLAAIVCFVFVAYAPPAHAQVRTQANSLASQDTCSYFEYTYNPSIKSRRWLGVQQSYDFVKGYGINYVHVPACVYVKVEAKDDAGNTVLSRILYPTEYVHINQLLAVTVTIQGDARSIEPLPKPTSAPDLILPQN